MLRTISSLPILIVLSVLLLPSVGQAQWARGASTYLLGDYSSFGLYPGAFCDHQRYRGYTQGGVFNSHNKNHRTMTCPAISTKRTRNHIAGYVDVVDRHPYKDFVCTLKHQINWAHGVTTVSGRTGTSRGHSHALQRISLIAPRADLLLGASTDPGEKLGDRTTYYFECLTPSQHYTTIRVPDIDGWKTEVGLFFSEIRQYWVGEWR